MLIAMNQDARHDQQRRDDLANQDAVGEPGRQSGGGEQ
jgi:hypothetical protein